ncbi:hypothetical protein [Streptomyces sp. NPDC059783]|uniref:hypothetical protein n=1 Tax=Streptomyces sp. NPDC059783 TaxID=3346944 RepID=UPI0036505AB0
MESSAEGAAPAGAEGRWTLSPEHVDRLSAWIADGAGTAGISPDRAADLLVQALTDGALPHWISTRART